MQYLSLTFSPAPVPSGSAARRPPNIQFSPPSPPLPFSRSLRSSRNSNIQPQILSPCPTPAIPSPLKHGNNPSISPHSSSYRPFILPYLLFNAPPPPRERQGHHVQKFLGLLVALISHLQPLSSLLWPAENSKPPHPLSLMKKKGQTRPNLQPILLDLLTKFKYMFFSKHLRISINLRI